MTSKIAILTDSSSSLDFATHQYDNVFQVRLSVLFDGVEYIDGISITNTEFFRRIVEEDIIPTTSQPSPGQVVEICKEIKSKGYTDVIYLPLSKGISSSYSSIMGSIDLIEGVNFTVVDTKATAVYLCYLALEAAKLTKENKSVEEIIKHVEHLRDHLRIYFMVNDLKYLVKNGRLSNAAGFIATMLKIKPVLEFDEEGKIVGTQKIRTTKKLLETIVESVSKETQGKKVQYCICHGLDIPLLNDLKTEIAKYINVDEILILPLPPVIGAHVGNSVVSFGYFVLDN
ncbi:MAG: DegV family protein [Haloplasmataceae bacterium]|jgi:DegV family protein with EDD domain|nr:DegV family protein [Haloplasmataceae bacterium]